MVDYSRINRISNPNNFSQGIHQHQTEKSSLNLPLIIIIGASVFIILLGILLFILQGKGSVRQGDESGLFAEEQFGETSGELVVDQNCDAFLNKLEECKPFSCEFEHPLAEMLGLEDTTMTKKIIGLTENGKCSYFEEMPNNGKMECKYTESMRKAMVQYYKDLSNAESTRVQVHSSLSPQGAETRAGYTVDGKEVGNPLQETLDNGQCVISGYG